MSTGSLIVLISSLLVAGPCLGQAEKVCPHVVETRSQAEMAELLKQARDRGAWWRLEKDGRLSYLYATVHVGKKEWIMPGPTIVRALREADVIAVELDVSDPAVRRGLLAKAEDEPPISSSDHKDREQAMDQFQGDVHEQRAEPQYPDAHGQGSPCRERGVGRLRTV